MAAAQALVGQTPTTLATMTTGTTGGNTGTSGTSKPAASITSTAPPLPKRRRVEGTVSLDFLLGLCRWVLRGWGGYNY